MTYKHNDFQSSPTMRSLAKIASNNGWIKAEVAEEKPAQPDLFPTTNLTQNILKLCNGLRNSGLNKYAEELEGKLMNYKQANSLYETSNEEGKDLIDAAHPKGSHKLEGVEGDAVIETILDQHIKILDKINKKPTGKLAT